MKKLSLLIIAIIPLLISNNVFAESLVEINLCNKTGTSAGGAIDLEIKGMDVDNSGKHREKVLMVDKCTVMGFDTYDIHKFISIKAEGKGVDVDSFYILSNKSTESVGDFVLSYVLNGYPAGTQITCDINYDTEYQLHCTDDHFGWSKFADIIRQPTED